MKYHSMKEKIYASVMILTMLIIGNFYSMKYIQPPRRFAAAQNGSTSSFQDTKRSESKESTSSAASYAFERVSSMPVSSESSKAESSKAESSKAESGKTQSSKAEPKTAKQASRYYDVPLSNDLQDLIFTECKSKKVPVDLVVALIDVESDFNPKLVSETNDYGLMQINICHKDFLQKTLQITDLLDEKQNIKAGVYMLSGIVNKYRDVNQALMVYNCGESGAKKLWNNGIYSTNYSKKVIAAIDQRKS